MKHEHKTAAPAHLGQVERGVRRVVNEGTGVGMTKKLKASYALRPETLIEMLHHAYVLGFITAVCDADDTDDEPIPVDQGGPRTELWVKQQADALLSMRRRPDGTYYLPASHNTPNVADKRGAVGDSA